MKIKLKHKPGKVGNAADMLASRSPMTEQTALAKIPTDLEELQFDESVRSVASLVGVSPEVLVEMFITKTYSRVVKRIIFNMPHALMALRRLEQEPIVRDLVLRKNYVLTTKDRRDIEAKYVSERITDELDGLIGSLLQRAKGCRAERYDPKHGGTVIVDVVPDTKAVIYLLDRVLGKPTALQEIDGKGKHGGGSIGKVQIFLPDNSRGDGPKQAMVDYSEVMKNAIVVDEEEEDD